MMDTRTKTFVIGTIYASYDCALQERNCGIDRQASHACLRLGCAGSDYSFSCHYLELLSGEQGTQVNPCRRRYIAAHVESHKLGVKIIFNPLMRATLIYHAGFRSQGAICRTLQLKKR